MNSLPVFSALYRFLSLRRTWLFAVTLAALALAALAFRGVHLEEDVAALLPDDRSDVASDFRLLQEAPLARKVLIEVRGGAGMTTEQLLDGADGLAAKLPPSVFRLLSSQLVPRGPGFFAWLSGSLPNLATAEDLEGLGAGLAPEEVRTRLREGQATLLAPEGWALKGLVRSDPLAFRDVVLAKLRSLSLVPHVRLERGHFVSQDGRRVLLVADTPVPMTDAAGAASLVGAFRRACSEGLPAGVTATLLCGHRYTLANAEAIRRDLAVVLGLSSVSILAIYVFCLRSRWSVFVFLVPASVLVLASGVLALAYKNVFAATVGFGGVLLGIADEYANYVYFAFRKGGKPPDRLIGEAARPVLFGGLATLGSFAVLFLSSLPGQRQLAVYSLTGIGASLLLSLVVLPHLVPPAPAGELGDVGLPLAGGPPGRWVVWVWVLFLVLCASQLGRVRFNGDLRALSLVPADLRADEEGVQAAWGDVRGKALVFAEGRNLEEALRANDRLFAFLKGKLPASDVVSLSPVLPSGEAREAARTRWAAYWSPERVRALEETLVREGKALGFTEEAFAPFVEGLRRAPVDGGPEGLEGAGLGEAVRSLLLRGADGVKVVTLVPDTAAVLALFQRPDRPAGVRLVSQTRFGDEVSRSIGRDFYRYLTVTSTLVVVLVVAAFRKLRKVLLALVPVLTGLLGAFGGMGLLGVEFNLFNTVATVLIIGVCVDYGIYMVCRSTEQADHGGDRAVLVSGLTTLAGLGVLVLARHPAMHSLGVTVLLGVTAAIPSALYVIPALSPRTR